MRFGFDLGRWLLCFVALCLAFQGLTLSVERARGRAHHHLDAARVAHAPPISEHGSQRHADLDGHRYAPNLAQHGRHRHATVSHHDHDATVDGVVYVADDDGASALNPHPTLARSIHELDVLVRPFDVPLETESAPSWANGDSRPFESHISDPLKRPPRA